MERSSYLLKCELRFFWMVIEIGAGDVEEGAAEGRSVNVQPLQGWTSVRASIRGRRSRGMRHARYAPGYDVGSLRDGCMAIRCMVWGTQKFGGEEVPRN